MSRTYIHALEAKFRNGILNYSEIPINLRKKWSRWNFDGGHFKNLRNLKRYSFKKLNY
jgi:hypothetical protein